MKLTAVKCSDNSWNGAGFKAVNGVVALSDIDVLFVKGTGGLIEWGWDKLPEGMTSICGVPAFRYEDKNTIQKQPNGVLSVDHIVLHSNDAEYVKNEFAKLNMTPRAQRDDIYPGITQIFYRPEKGVVIEVVVNKDFPKTFLWGMTLVVEDIDIAKQLLKDNSSNPKKAIQPGRRILTVRGAQLNIETNMAMMTPHVPKGKL